MLRSGRPPASGFGSVPAYDRWTPNTTTCSGEAWSLPQVPISVNNDGHLTESPGGTNLEVNAVPNTPCEEDFFSAVGVLPDDRTLPESPLKPGLPEDTELELQRDRLGERVPITTSQYDRQGLSGPQTEVVISSLQLKPTRSPPSTYLPQYPNPDPNIIQHSNPQVLFPARAVTHSVNSKGNAVNDISLQYINPTFSPLPTSSTYQTITYSPNYDPNSFTSNYNSNLIAQQNSIAPSKTAIAHRNGRIGIPPANHRLMCPTSGCKVITSTRKELKIHQKVHQRVSCTIEGCNITLGNRDALKKHLRTVHKQGEPWKTLCGKELWRKDSFQRHSCDECVRRRT